MRITVMLLTLSLAASANLLVNGSFEQPFSVGWRDTVSDFGGEYRIERSDTLGQPGPGYAARVYKYLAEFASLYQTVDVPGASLSLEFDARFTISGGSSTCWPVASLWVRYRNAFGAELGNTRFYRPSPYATWVRSDTVSLIEIAENGVWRHYALDIAHELATNLRGINPAQVRKITIDLFSYGSGT
ncbi:hypothetical protein FJY69_03910 [candidate division WOR-3 bacterium]|nr:hypothetical protein [candidate division WOR-3 bacterium]